MKRLLILLICGSLFFTLATTETLAQSKNFTLKKIAPSGSELAFSVKDALKVVEIFMGQSEWILNCRANTVDNILHVTGKNGKDLELLMADPGFLAQLNKKGYLLELSGEAIAHDDHTHEYEHDQMTENLEHNCSDCNDVPVSEELKNSIVGDAEYDSEQIIFDFNTGSGSFGSFDANMDNSLEGLSTETSPNLNLDSLSRIINKDFLNTEEKIDPKQ